MRIIGTALCAVALGAFGTAASAATISFGETFSPVAIADASTASRTIDVTTVGTIVDLDVVVDFSQSGDWINSDGSISGSGYPFPEELSLTLQSAQGTSVTLIGTGSYSNGSAGRYVFTFTTRPRRAMRAPPPPAPIARPASFPRSTPKR